MDASDVRRGRFQFSGCIPHAGAGCGSSTQARSDLIGSISNFRAPPSRAFDNPAQMAATQRGRSRLPNLSNTTEKMGAEVSTVVD